MTIAEGLDPDGSMVLKSRLHFLATPFDQVGMSNAARMIGRQDPDSRFRYVVTPNADHVVRLNREEWLRPVYEGAWLALCDSKPIWLFARARSQPLFHVTGSDLTVELFRSVIRKGDRIALIVGSDQVASGVQAAFPDVDFRIHVPPMGLLADAAAQQACIDFTIDAKARLVFLAVGSPQSELIAYRLSRNPEARGTGLCIGASLEFLVGAKSRAPKWLQRIGRDWLHRMISDPKRLWRRYVFGTLPLLALCAREAVSGTAADRRR